MLTSRCGLGQLFGHGLKAMALAITLFGAGAVLTAQTVPVRSGENLALGKACTLDPAPDYSRCTDPGDATQLTDGQYRIGYCWTQKGTVGWNNAYPAVITLDLGTMEPSRGVSFNTAAGVAGVEWPQAVYVLVSDDGKTFHEAGELVSLSAEREPFPKAGYAVHRLWTDALETHGRFVAFIVAAAGYAFSDEIEVYRGEPSWVTLPQAGEPVSDLRRYCADQAVSRGVLQRLRQDIEAVRKLAEKPEIPASARQQAQTELEAVAHELPRLENAKWPADFRAVLPLNDAHRRDFRAQAKLWRSAGLVSLVAWQSPLWDPLALVELPQRQSPAAVIVALMANVYRAGSFDLSNPADAHAVLKLQIVGLPGGLNPSWITVHEAQWTDTRPGQPVAAALPVAHRTGDQYEILVPAGLTRQVWLTVHPVDLAGGVYQGQIKLAGAGASIALPLTVRVYPLQFPDRPTLHLGGWDYTDVDQNYMINPANREAVLAHLREHFVDSPWATAAVLPYGTYAQDGRMATPPSTTQFGQWLKRWSAARQYCVFAAVGEALEQFKMGAPQFATAVGEWIDFWARQVRQRGLQPEQIALLLVDEPSSAAQ